MTDATYLHRRPWASDTNVEGLPRGMLGGTEAALLYRLARDYYGGYGDIIDAGAFLGSSSYCLARGLSENRSIAAKANRLHAFDLFEVWKEPGGTDEGMIEAIRRDFGVDLAGYESTVGLYTANLGPLARLVTIHQGDILKAAWSGRPIEILFVDVCKTLPIWKHVVRTFFASLIPGVSLVLHQDWHHPWLPYLHVGQEYMADYFEVFEHKVNDTAGWRLVDRIPDRVIDRVAAYDFTAAEQRALMDRAIERFAGRARFLKLAKAVLLLEAGHVDEASRIVHENVFGHGEQVTDGEQGYYAVFAGGVAEAAERAGLSGIPGFDEAAYLRANPDVARMVADGIFDTGLRHWFRHGRWEDRAQG